jgi:hypothetical protein
MSREGSTRRRVLRRGSVAVAGLVGVAGCSGGGSSTTTGDRPGDGSYANWLPTPSRLVEEQHYEYLYIDVSSLRTNESYVYPGGSSGLGRYFDSLASRTGAAPESTEGYLSIGSEGIRSGNTLTLLGSYDPTAIGESLQDAYERNHSVGEYAVFTGDGDYSAVGVGEDGIVVPGATGGQGDVDTVLRARTGEEDRYAGSDPDFERLIEALGTGFLVSGGTNPRYEAETVQVENPQFVGQVAGGATLRIDGETTAVTYVFVFDSESDADAGPVEKWLELERTSGLVFPFDPGSAEKSGRIVRATGSTPTDQLFGGE